MDITAERFRYKYLVSIMNTSGGYTPKTVFVFGSVRKPLLLGFGFNRSDLPLEHGPWRDPPGLAMLIYRNHPRENLKDVEILEKIDAHRFYLLAEKEAKSFIKEYMATMDKYFSP